LNTLKPDHDLVLVLPLPTRLAVAEVAVADHAAPEVAVNSSCHIKEFRENVQSSL
jgi:hypothetical protein